MLRPLSRHPQAKPETGDIVRDGAGNRYRVVSVGLKYMTCRDIYPDGGESKGVHMVKVNEAIKEAPPTAPDPEEKEKTDWN